MAERDLHGLHALRRSGEFKWRLPMSNTAKKIALILVVLALPAAAFARGAAGGSAGMAARGALIGSAQMQGQMGMQKAPAVAPLPPPRITVPAIPQFK